MTRLSVHKAETKIDGPEGVQSFNVRKIPFSTQYESFSTQYERSYEYQHLGPAGAFDQEPTVLNNF